MSGPSRAGAEVVPERAWEARADVQALLAALRARGLDSEPGEVSALSVAVARELGVGEGEIVDVAHVAALHEVGKIGMPAALLNKIEPLDEGERKLMTEHTRIGAQIVSSLPGLEHLAGAIAALHERFDGNGYPDGLAGRDIPLASRIVFACEAYRAMLADRPYRRALTAADALKVLDYNAASQFDPAVVNAIFAVLAPGAGSAPPPAPRDGPRPPVEDERPAAAPAPPVVPVADVLPESLGQRGREEEIGPAPPGEGPEAEPPSEREANAALAAARWAPVADRAGAPARARRRRPRRLGPRTGVRQSVVHASALVAGLALGLYLALPAPDVRRQHLCPPAHEGLVQCELQKQWLPTVTVVLGVAAACLVLVHLLTVSGPSLIRRWRTGELWGRERRPPPFDSDPVLRAATWGLTYEDANPGGRRPHRVWKDSSGRPLG